MLVRKVKLFLGKYWRLLKYRLVARGGLLEVRMPVEGVSSAGLFLPLDIWVEVTAAAILEGSSSGSLLCLGEVGCFSWTDEGGGI